MEKLQHQLLCTNTMKSDRRKQLGLTVLAWFSRHEPCGSCWICSPHKETEFHPLQWTINISTYTYFMQKATPLLSKIKT